MLSTESIYHVITELEDLDPDDVVCVEHPIMMSSDQALSVEELLDIFYTLYNASEEGETT